MKHKKLLALLLMCIGLLAFSATAFAQGQTGWSTDDSGTHYYGSNDAPYQNGVYQIDGAWYGFSVDGIMYDNEVFSMMTYNEALGYWEDTFYRAKVGGQLFQNNWVKDADGDWTYYNNNCIRVDNEVLKINGKLYGFDWNGKMYFDTSFDIYDEVTGITTYYYAQGGTADGALLTNSWKQPFLAEYDDTSWYYYGSDGKMYRSCVAQISGKQYCFTEYGDMLEGMATTITIDGVNRHFVADQNGIATEIPNNTWKQINGSWYYVQNGELCRGDTIYLINGKYYGFDWDSKMFDNTFFTISMVEGDTHLGDKEYYAKPGGALAQNEVIFTSISGNTNYYLFGADCLIPTIEGLYELNGVMYYLYGDCHSPVRTDFIIETENGVYHFDEKGAGKKLSTGWHKLSIEGETSWYYISGMQYLKNGIHQIGSKKYAFNEAGQIQTNQLYWDSSIEKFRLATYMDKDGKGGSICEEKNVWKTIHGEWVYLSADSTLYEGWLGTYYLDPYMTYCTFTVGDDGYMYSFNQNGLSKKLTNTGFLTIDSSDSTYYLQQGKVVKSNWVYDKAWYYFDEYGQMILDCSYEVKGTYYFFDQNGKMYDNGWIRNSVGEWYWAAKNGALFTGKDSAGYVFNEYGKLIVDDVDCVDGVWYVTNRDGKSLGGFTNPGWNQVAGNWYYLDVDEHGNHIIKDDSFVDNQGRYFAFDIKGRMLSNQFYQNHYLGSNGNALTGWQWIEGHWYYGNPDNHGAFYNSGGDYINGKEYYFIDNGQLVQNKTFFSWYYDAIITVDKDGVITNRTEANGWQYYEDSSWGEGDAFYFVNGNPYSGWLGNYYIENGQMVIDNFFRDANGKQYYLDVKGKKLPAGWNKLWGNWVCVKSDGSLFCNEWLYNGGKWYYFNDVYMATSPCIIDGITYYFDSDGVWLDEHQKPPTDKEGWVNYNGEWYFCIAGELVTDRELYINGKWYYFDCDGVMLANKFYYQHGNAGGYFYYTANGSRAEYVGWQKIDGEWVYFNNNHTTANGWILDNGKYYYQEAGLFLVRGYQVIDNILYQFNNDGALVKNITAPGWHQYDSDWFYVNADGTAVADISKCKIGSHYYAFDYEGKMVANDIWAHEYYDANGRLVTRSGWYQIDDEWIYVTSHGTIADYGVYRINGKDYYFNGGYWVK